MWIRGVLSLLCLAFVAGAVLLWDCVTTVINLASGDPLGLCAAFDGFGIGNLGLVATGLVVFAFVVLALIWIPVYREHRRQMKAQPELALIQNISRLSDPYQDRDKGWIPETGNGDLKRRIEVLETAFESGGSGERDLTTEWIWLLAETNRRHNSGDLPTEEFKGFNTRLLDVVAGSGRSESAGAAAT